MSIDRLDELTEPRPKRGLCRYRDCDAPSESLGIQLRIYRNEKSGSGDWRQAPIGSVGGALCEHHAVAIYNIVERFVDKDVS